MSRVAPLRCLVMGAGGFIGGHLAEQLVARGHAVRALDRPGFDPRGAAHLAGTEWHAADFGDAAAVARAIDGCDVLFHLVATTLPASSNADPGFDLRSNVEATLRLLEAAVRGRVRKVVFISSGGTVYGIPSSLPIAESAPTHPICAYGVHKLAIEKYLHLWQHLHGLQYAVLRVSNPYGERQRHDAGQGSVAAFLARALRGEPIEIWGDGTVVRDYLHVADVARALALAGESAAAASVLNVGSGVGRSLNQVIAAIEDTVERKLVVHRKAARPFDVPANVLDVSKAARELGWRAEIGLADGLAATARWMAGTLGVAAPRAALASRA